MSKKACKALSLLVISVMSFLPASLAFAGLGLSPSQMISKNLIKGAHMEKTFVLSRSDPKEGLYFTVTTEGDTKDWTVLDKGTSFTMPAGQQRYEVKVIANIPKDAANGRYKGGVRMASTPNPTAPTTGSGATTALAALIQTDFTITGDQVLEYEISAIQAQNIELGSPLEISMTVNNTGNVLARPTRVHVDIYDKFNKELLESHDITEMSSVEPFTIGNITLQFPPKTRLGIEQYWARVSAYRDDAVVKESSTVFEIVEVGTLQKGGNLKEMIYEKYLDPGSLAKISGVFENTGKTNYAAKLVAEVSRGGKLVKLIESDLVTINKGKTENLSAYFTPDQIGTYTVKARVSFSGGKSNEKEIKIYVGVTGFFGLSKTAIAVLLVILVLIIATGVYLKRKKMSAKSS